MVLVYLPDRTMVVVPAGTVEGILVNIGLNPYEILVTCGGDLLLADEFVTDDQVLVTTSIVHGG
jgi:sulfur carrier protein ThiS